jgi:hypothetical protein
MAPVFKKINQVQQLFLLATFFLLLLVSVCFIGGSRYWKYYDRFSVLFLSLLELVLSSNFELVVY